MPNYRTLFQDHHNIEQQTLKNSELLAKLQEAGKFSIHAPENRLFLPASPEFAHALDVTPHGGGPLAAYQNGVLERLDRIAATKDGQAALRGDPEAMGRVVQRVEQFRDTIKAGLINGDLNTNTPIGSTPPDTTRKVHAFFKNIGEYYQEHRQQVDSLKGFTGIDHTWGAVAGSESRIITTLNQFESGSTPLIRGGNVPLQRNGLAVAISNAHHDGRVVLSEEGIRTVERTLGEEAGYRLRVPRGQQGFASLEMLVGTASMDTLARTGGIVATGVDAITTAKRTAELMSQDNVTAAQSEFNHAVARNGGGWLGGASMAAVVGTSGYLPVTVVALDALLISKSFEHGADLRDNKAIFQQKDRAGVQWEFTGQNWVRQGMLDRTADGVGNPIEQPIGANYERARELNAYASAKAVDLALGKVPAPENPFNLPAKPGDQHGLDNPNWHRDPNSEQWVRTVKTGMTGANDRGVYANEVATLERAMELNQEAVARVERNIANGREAVAAAYTEDHAALRSFEFVPTLPPAVVAATAQPNRVLGSDNKLYERNELGVWSHEGQLAAGNLALELDLTRQLRQPVIEQAQERLAEIQARPAPTNADINQNELLHRQHSYGSPAAQAWLPAIELATRRTREANGIEGYTQQEPQRDEQGVLSVKSPILHYQAGPDGVSRVVATTSAEEIQQAFDELRAEQGLPPIQNAPELRISALTPQQWEAHEQALREANRQGGSVEEAAQAANVAARQADGVQVENARGGPIPLGSREWSPNALPIPPAEPAAATVRQVPPAHTEPTNESHRETKQLTPSAEEGARVRDEGRVPVRQPKPQEDKLKEHEAVASPELSRPEPSLVSATQPTLADTRAVQASLANSSEPELLPQRGSLRQGDEVAPRRVDPVRQRVDESGITLPAHQLLGPSPLHQPEQQHQDPRQPGHRDHGLYLQIREHVTQLDKDNNRQYDDTSERLTGSLMVLAKKNGLERVDHVVLSTATPELQPGHSVFVVQGELNNPAHRRSAMETVAAISAPFEQSVQQVDAVTREQEVREQQQVIQQREEQAQQNEQVQSAARRMT